MLLTHVETIHSHTLIYGSMTCFEYSYHVSTKLCNYELLGFRLSKQSYMWFTHGSSLEDFFSLMMSSTRRYMEILTSIKLLVMTLIVQNGTLLSIIGHCFSKSGTNIQKCSLVFKIGQLCLKLDTCISPCRLNIPHSSTSWQLTQSSGEFSILLFHVFS